MDGYLLALVIYMALTALAADPGLWLPLNNGDNLLFERKDFCAPFETEVWKHSQGRRRRGRQARPQAQGVLRARFAAREPDGHDRADLVGTNPRVTRAGHQAASRAGQAERTGGLRAPAGPGAVPVGADGFSSAAAATGVALPDQGRGAVAVTTTTAVRDRLPVPAEDEARRVGHADLQGGDSGLVATASPATAGACRPPRADVIRRAHRRQALRIFAVILFVLFLAVKQPVLAVVIGVAGVGTGSLLIRGNPSKPPGRAATRRDLPGA